jgi:hypothetical protein
MWIMMSDAFLSLVKKDCAPDELLVRARRPGDIEKVFPGYKVTRLTDADYLFRARIPIEVACAALCDELRGVTYSNYKSSVRDPDLHHALIKVWHAMAELQDPAPYSGRRPSFLRNSIYTEDPSGKPASRRKGGK